MVTACVKLQARRYCPVKPSSAIGARIHPPGPHQPAGWTYSTKHGHINQPAFVATTPHALPHALLRSRRRPPDQPVRCRLVMDLRVARSSGFPASGENLTGMTDVTAANRAGSP